MSGLNKKEFIFLKKAEEFNSRACGFWHWFISLLMLPGTQAHLVYLLAFDSELFFLSLTL